MICSERTGAITRLIIANIPSSLVMIVPIHLISLFRQFTIVTTDIKDNRRGIKSYLRSRPVHRYRMEFRNRDSADSNEHNDKILCICHYRRVDRFGTRVYDESNITTNMRIMLVYIFKLRINLPLDYNVICLNPNSHKPQRQHGARTVSRFKKNRKWVLDLRKTALILIVLLVAGIGLTLGQAAQCTGNCNCPAGTSCSHSTCGAGCGGSCGGAASSATPCGSHCPIGGCGSAGGCHSCCGSNCAGCC